MSYFTDFTGASFTLRDSVFRGKSITRKLSRRTDPRQI